MRCAHRGRELFGARQEHAHRREVLVGDAHVRRRELALEQRARRLDQDPGAVTGAAVGRARAAMLHRADGFERKANDVVGSLVGRGPRGSRPRTRRALRRRMLHHTAIRNAPVIVQRANRRALAARRRSAREKARLSIRLAAALARAVREDHRATYVGARAPRPPPACRQLVASRCAATRGCACRAARRGLRSAPAARRRRTRRGRLSPNSSRSRTSTITVAFSKPTMPRTSAVNAMTRSASSTPMSRSATGAETG